MVELLVVAAIAAGLMAGIFFTFSSFVMPALNNTKPTIAIAAMRRINIDVFCWSFGLLFFGLPAASVGLGAFSLTQFDRPWAIYGFIGSALYLVGTFVVTMIGNVPLNNRLARVKPDSDDDENAVWQSFSIPWVRWNHVRTLAAIGAAILFTLGALAAGPA